MCVYMNLSNKQGEKEANLLMENENGNGYIAFPFSVTDNFSGTQHSTLMPTARTQKCKFYGQSSVTRFPLLRVLLPHFVLFLFYLVIYCRFFLVYFSTQQLKIG